MALLEILTHPDPRLRLVAQSVTRIDADLQRLIDDMIETMHAANGVGLAAPQIGASVRLVVMDVGRKDPEKDEWASDLQVFINPRIVEADGEITWKEGCLSVPGVNADVVRRGRVVLDFVDRTGAPQRLEATGLRAVCIQHELDHLEGTLYVDRLEPLEQKLTLADYERRRTETSAGAE